MVPVPGMADHTKSGGTHTHKDPNCQCRPCAARRRKAEAFAFAAGTGRPALVPQTTPPTTPEQINADHPLVVSDTTTPKARVLQWMTVRATEPGIANSEVARRMGISRQALTSILNRAVSEGWLKFDDPLSRIDHEVIPKVMDNLNYFLDARDRTVTIEAAKGTIFRSYQEANGIAEGPQTVLAIKIESSDGEQKVAIGSIVGKPRELKEQ